MNTDLTPLEVFDSIPVTPSGDLFIKVATPEQLAYIMANSVLRAEGTGTMAVHMAEFDEEFQDEPSVVAHLRIRGIWLVTRDLSVTEPRPNPNASSKHMRGAIAFAAVIVVGLIALALGGKL